MDQYLSEYSTHFRILNSFPKVSRNCFVAFRHLGVMEGLFCRVRGDPAQYSPLGFCFLQIDLYWHK